MQDIFADIFLESNNKWNIFVLFFCHLHMLCSMTINHCVPILSSQMPFSNTSKIWIQQHVVKKTDMFTCWPTVREWGLMTESSRKGIEVVREEKGRNRNVAKAKRNYINLSECIWSWACEKKQGWKNVFPGRGWRRAGKCNATMWLATETFCDFVHVQNTASLSCRSTAVARV